MKPFRFLLGIALLVLAAQFTGIASALPDSDERGIHTMAIQLRINGHMLTATLNNSQAAHDFFNQLPLTSTLEDYAGAERISTLPHKLRTTGSPAGSSAKAGNIAYYAPWGNLVILYQDVRYANGLVILGHLNGDTSVLRGKGDLQVTIKAVP